jgi:hypothetical protein
MSELYVMRRANGDLFTVEAEGERRIPVWPSKEAAARYKARNPDLMVFFPALLDRSILLRAAAKPESAAPPRFLLLPEDSPDANLYEGRLVAVEEVFLEGAGWPASIAGT